MEYFMFLWVKSGYFMNCINQLCFILAWMQGVLCELWTKICKCCLDKLHFFRVPMGNFLNRIVCRKICFVAQTLFLALCIECLTNDFNAFKHVYEWRHRVEAPCITVFRKSKTSPSARPEIKFSVKLMKLFTRKFLEDFTARRWK